MTGFLSALAAVLVSEVGDRTFIVTTILAMREPKVSVFLGAVSAAGLMVSISGLIGASSALVPATVTRLLSITLFLVFGVQMLLEGRPAPHLLEPCLSLTLASPSL